MIAATWPGERRRAAARGSWETACADLAISPAAREMLYNAIQTILENDPQ